MTEHRKEYMRQWRAANRWRQRNYNLKRNPKRQSEAQARYYKSKKRPHRLNVQYGITQEDYSRMLTEQGGLCAICGNKNVGDKMLHVDHCHDTGEVRGLLCHYCNTGIGSLKHDVAVLVAAIDYLTPKALEAVA